MWSIGDRGTVAAVERFFHPVQRLGIAAGKFLRVSKFRPVEADPAVCRDMAAVRLPQPAFAGKRLLRVVDRFSGRNDDRHHWFGWGRSHLCRRERRPRVDRRVVLHHVCPVCARIAARDDRADVAAARPRRRRGAARAGTKAVRSTQKQHGTGQRQMSRLEAPTGAPAREIR